MDSSARKKFVLTVPTELDINAVIRMLESNYIAIEYPSKDSDSPTRTLFIHILEKDLYG